MDLHFQASYAEKSAQSAFLADSAALQTQEFRDLRLNGDDISVNVHYRPQFVTAHPFSDLKAPTPGSRTLLNGARCENRSFPAGETAGQ